MAWIQSRGSDTGRANGPSWRRRDSTPPETESPSLRTYRIRSHRREVPASRARPRQPPFSALLSTRFALVSSCRSCMQARSGAAGRTRPGITFTGAGVQTFRGHVVTRQSIRSWDSILNVCVVPRSGASERWRVGSRLQSDVGMTNGPCVGTGPAFPAETETPASRLRDAGCRTHPCGG